MEQECMLIENLTNHFMQNNINNDNNNTFDASQVNNFMQYLYANCNLLSAENSI